MAVIFIAYALATIGVYMGDNAPINWELVILIGLVGTPAYAIGYLIGKEDE